MRRSVPDLAALVPDGATVALAPDYSGSPMALVLELARRGIRDLHLVGVPQLGLAADILIGAGCVATVETAAISLGEHGLAPAFGRAFAERRIAVRDSTCPAIHAGLQAAEKAIPYMPIRGVLGTDLLRARGDWRVEANPFPPHDPLVLVPAIRPDVALIHSPLADEEGNVWIGVRRELMLMAHASAVTLVTAEHARMDSLLADPLRASGTIPALYVEAIAEAPGGSRPLGLPTTYAPDSGALRAYAEAAATEQGFKAWLEWRLKGGALL